MVQKLTSLDINRDTLREHLKKVGKKELKHAGKQVNAIRCTHGGRHLQNKCESKIVALDFYDKTELCVTTVHSTKWRLEKNSIQLR